MSWRYTGPLETDAKPTNIQNASADSTQSFLSEIRMQDWANQWRTGAGETPIQMCHPPIPWFPHPCGNGEVQDRTTPPQIPQYLPPFDVGPPFGGGCFTPHPRTPAEEEWFRKFLEDYKKTQPLDTRAP
jgi:hypothetical protein